MVSLLTEHVRDLVRQLITNISGFKESSEYFKTVELFAFSHVGSNDYFFTYDKRDIEKTVESLGEKFRFHGFASQAEAIQALTQRFFEGSTFKEDLEVRVSLMKMLLLVSNSPTQHFAENPEFYKPRDVKEEEIEDWSSFLNDTKYPVPVYSDTSDWSDNLSSTTDESDIVQSPTHIEDTDVHIDSEPKSALPKIDLQARAQAATETLRTTVQCEWWNQNLIQIKPISDDHEANIAFEWDKFVCDSTMGLLHPSTNIISEYKVMRELIWQFFAPHTCVSFGFEGEKLVPNSNMTIGSVRSHTFQYFLHEFVPYFEMLKCFRDFQLGLEGEYFVPSIPDTYRSYSCALTEILDPVMRQICDIEDRVRKQEKTMTLLNIAKELKPLFKDLEIVYDIHKELVKVYKIDNSFNSATFLLSRLYYGLLNPSDLVEQNLYLTLYLHSFYKYFTIIEIWLTQDTLDDLSDEFVIVDKNPNELTLRDISASTSTKIDYHNQDWQMSYSIRNLDVFSKMDGMLNIICTKIFQLGKNIHLLRLLGKLHLINDEYAPPKESLHEEFVQSLLKEAKIYMPDISAEFEEACGGLIAENVRPEPQKLFSVICPEHKVSETGMDSIENFVDLTDGFLATVFEPYLYQDTKEPIPKKETLYKLINKSITKMFPVKQILEKTFTEVLNKRYNFPGLMVKNILINEYDLKKQFSLMKHMYLFEDDIICPLYKKMFLQFESHQMWGNFFWLTSQLQDLLMDHFPECYENIRVDVDPNWRLCTNPITACELISVHCRITWPVNIIIRSEHITKYHMMFQFILKLKWGINTLNRLPFSDLEPKNKPFKLHSPLIKDRIRKLESLRFLLLNIVSSIAHYVLGHLFSSLWRRFDDDLEKSFDLESLIQAHDRYINRIFCFCLRITDHHSEVCGFGKVLQLVAELHCMWHNLHQLDDILLKTCEIDYLKCYKYLKPITEINVPEI